ncbi:MAG: ABC transporter ATP-binding protein [Ilumatobacter sp.]
MTGDAVVRVDAVSRVFVIGGEVADVVALDSVTLELRAGEVTVLRGPSGSGKTTLLNIAAGLDRATTGSVIALGERLDDMSDDAATRWRRANTASIFQAKGLVAHLTAIENADLALRLVGAQRRTRRSRAEQALAAVGLSEHLDHRPAQLSGGQQQRVAIARALVVRAPLLVADEPTGELDSETAAEMIELMVDDVRERGAVALIATHDDALAAAADRVVSLADGRLVEADNA